MRIGRRKFLIGLTALGALPTRTLAKSARGNPLFAAACTRPDGTHAAAVFSSDGFELKKIHLPARGHDIAVNPRNRHCVVFARRPGNFAVAFSLDQKKIPVKFFTKPNRHFYGHGIFSPDGRFLFTTENDFENTRGVIGVRQTSNNFRQIAEFPSGGTGPHDLAFLGDGRTLVVANGGIATHPQHGRAPLNLATMSSSITYIDAHNGTLLDTQKLEPELHQLSIRHLSITPDDQVFFGCQFKGRGARRPQLIGSHRPGEKLHLLELPRKSLHRLQNYIGSIEVSRDGRTVLASSPRGGIAVSIDAKTAEIRAQYMLKDVAGIAPVGNRTPYKSADKFADKSADQSADQSADKSAFLLTSGHGAIAKYDPLTEPDKQKLKPVQTDNQWDNHLAAL